MTRSSYHPMKIRIFAMLAILVLATPLLTGCAVEERRVSTTQTTTTRQVTTSPTEPPVVTETRTTRTY